MLRFTGQQAAAVMSARRFFNESQTALSARLSTVQNAELVGNASPIPLESWRRIDGRAATIQRDVLQVFNRLAAASQTPVAVADLMSFFPQVSDSGEVNVSMDGRSNSRQDQAMVKYLGTPVPVFDAYARFGWRQMEMIRRGGGFIDMETIANHQRRVAEAMENMALNGRSDIVVDGATIYGLRTFPERSTDTHGFDLNGATGANWITAFKKLIDKLQADNAFGRVTVFLNYSDWTYAGLTEFAAGYPKTILQRVQEIPNVAELVPCSRVPASELIGINEIGSGNWGSVLSAMPLTQRPKARHNPEDDYVIGVMAMAATQFRNDYDGRSQIAHVTKV